MNKSIKTIWGIALIVVLLASMIVSAIPAAAGTLAWGSAGQPNPTLSNQIAAADANIVRVAPNGDIFVIDRQAAQDTIWKTVNGGQTFTTTTPTIGAPWSVNATVIDIQTSPSYATDSTVFLLVNGPGADGIANNGDDTVNVYISSNAGATFAQLGGDIGAGGAQVGTSLAIEPTYQSGTGQIAVSTSTAGGAGNIYTWGTGGVLNWTTTAFNLTRFNISRVAFSPLYPIDATVIAVTQNATATYIQYKVASTAWGANVAAQAVPASATNAAVITSEIAFPTDFNASIALSRNFFVGIGASAATDNVFRVRSTGATSLAVVAAEQPIASVAYKGTYASGTLYVGLVANTNVYYTNNANSTTTVTWIPTGKAPTGATGGTDTVFVALSGNNVYAGTTGAESAFNVSYDGGANFYQIGLIDTTLTSLQDLALGGASEWYLATSNAGGLESLWKSTDGGTTWVRIHTLSTTSQAVGIALSQNFATDKTMYFYETVTGSAAIINLSQDGGNTWTPRAFPGTITNVAQVVAVDQYTIYVGSGNQNTVYKSVNNGWTWATQTLNGSTGVNQMKIDMGSGALLAGTINGLVFLSTNGTTWTQQGATVGAGGPLVVGFDANYGTNSMFYAGRTTGAGIYRQATTTSTLTAWFNIDAGAVSANTSDIYVAPDGVLYASQLPANAGAVRALVPTSGAGAIATSPTPVLLNNVTAATFVLPAGATLTSIDYLPGSNVIYSIDSANTRIRTFTDTLSTPIPAVVSPAADAIVNAGAVTVVIEPVAGANAYQVQWNTRDDWLGTGGTEVFLGAPFYSRVLGSSLINTTPPAGAVIYYRVRVNGPVVGPWSATMMVQTQLTTAPAPNAPAIVPPASPEGSTVQGGFNVDPVASFFWGAIAGAANYEFQLATDPAFTSLVVDMTGANALGNVLAYTVTSPLNYGTMYYWRVRATSATSETAWSVVQAFRVMDKPVVAPTSTSTGPAITITTQPAPTITFTQPQATATTITIPPAPAAQEVGPAYIWAIIIIGAVLVIAVIVLIVRTRRSV